MPSEFDLVFEDFKIELIALEGMIGSLANVSGNIASARSRVAGANAATLLLAAMFEEFIRQQVRAIFVAKATSACSLEVFPKKIAGVVWRRSLERLSRASLDDLSSDPRSLNEKLKAVVDFCVAKDVTADVSDAVIHNEQNMRPEEMNSLFNRVGVSNMCARSCAHAPLMAFLGCETEGSADAELRARLEDFFRRRNEIAHAVQLNSSSGPPALALDIALFRHFGEAIASESASSCGLMSADGPSTE